MCGNAILFQFSNYYKKEKNDDIPQGPYQEVLQGTKQLTLKISTLQLSLLLSARDSA